MASRVVAARYVSRRLSSSGNIFNEEEKAAENIYIKKMEKELEKLARKSHKAEEKAEEQAEEKAEGKAEEKAGTPASDTKPGSQSSSSTDK